MEHRAKRDERDEKSGETGQKDRGQKEELRIVNCETGNPPEGWESGGQFQKMQKIENLLWERLSSRDPAISTT